MADKREYSEIEIEAARNALKAGFEWVARDRDAGSDETERLYAHREKPHKDKGRGEWQSPNGGYSFTGFVPLFESIRWEDDEPVRLRDIVPQILTDEEREWLRVVVRPFRDRLKSVAAYDGMFYGRYIAFSVAPLEGMEQHGDERDCIQIPKGSFTGMEENKGCTPEELGI